MDILKISNHNIREIVYTLSHQLSLFMTLYLMIIKLIVFMQKKHLFLLIIRNSLIYQDYFRIMKKLMKNLLMDKLFMLILHLKLKF